MNLKHLLGRASGPIWMVVAALSLAGCGSTAKDETSGWSPEKLYAEAREEATSGSLERAARLY